MENREKEFRGYLEKQGYSLEGTIKPYCKKLSGKISKHVRRDIFAIDSFEILDCIYKECFSENGGIDEPHKTSSNALKRYIEFTKGDSKKYIPNFG
jgi:hypothetical protein